MTQPSSADSHARSAKRILLLSASVGAGHNQAARAVEAHLQRKDPDLELHRRDVLDCTSPLFRLRYAGGYEFLVTRLPKLYGLGYRMTDRPQHPGFNRKEKIRLWQERRALRRLVAYVRDLRPDVIVHTHFLAPPALAHAMAEESLPRIPQVILVTDIIPHRWWYCPTATRYFTVDPAGVEKMRRWGIEAERISLSGIAVHPRWTDPPPPEATIRREWMLPDTGPVIVLSAGTDFACGPLTRLAGDIAQRCPQACVVALAGRNKKLLGALAACPKTREGRIVPVAFTDRLAELLSVANMMVTKAGGMTTAECLAKALPMVFLRPVPGQEQINAEYLAERGAGVISPRAARTAEMVAGILDDPHRLGEMSERAGQLHRPAGNRIAREVLEILESSTKGRAEGA